MWLNKLNHSALQGLMAAALSLPAAAALAYDRGPDVGISLSVAQPGVYGRIEIGPHEMPRVVYPQTVVVQPAAVSYRPLYVYAPDVHVRHWHQHCHRYGACDRPVYFVRDDWVRDQYRHGRHERHEHEGRHGHGHGYGRD